ncbi:hypothetical protein JQ629_29330 [Bradyrhizobium sp. AUGA SZCCT0222]|uniref:hypothetical protein n=1 Tax=Bradyrhizobium sp. AUGA SZCCT0222 TaxID=2807668 RepID=UPI001BACD8F1|nr:hypothetical protein [Bradyrhizobium sp. AUGA SZCCT0222]MBR1271596.1 hypothetical protein [Bradyrhizobium sp. AUGA SZCCT0222]
MVVLFEHWSDHALPSLLQIGGIKLEDSYRIWFPPERVRAFDTIRLTAQRRGKTEIEAQLNYIDYVEWRGLLISAIWRECLSGNLYVRAKRANAVGASTYEFISTDRIREIWPYGPLFPNSDYDDIQLYGPVPPWIKITVDGQFYLDEFLVQEFQYTDDYSFVVMRGVEFELGALQASVVRILHQAVFDPQHWRYETEIQQEAQCGLISDLFKRHPKWPELIEKVGRGRYRLNLRSEQGRPTVIFSKRDG